MALGRRGGAARRVRPGLERRSQPGRPHPRHSRRGRHRPSLGSGPQHRQLGPPLTGHTDRVYGVAFSPDGRTLASASADKTVRALGRADPPATRPAPRRARARSSDRRVQPGRPHAREWRLGRHGAALGRRGHAGSSAHRSPGTAIRWTRSPSAPDGHTVAEYGLDGRIRLWDVGTRRQLGRPLGPTGYGRSVAFSPDGRILASSAATTAWCASGTRAPSGSSAGLSNVAARSEASPSARTAARSRAPPTTAPCGCGTCAAAGSSARR